MSKAIEKQIDDLYKIIEKTEKENENRKLLIVELNYLIIDQEIERPLRISKTNSNRRYIVPQ